MAAIPLSQGCLRSLGRMSGHVDTWLHDSTKEFMHSMAFASLFRCMLQLGSNSTDAFYLNKMLYNLIHHPGRRHAYLRRMPRPTVVSSVPSRCVPQGKLIKSEVATARSADSRHLHPRQPLCYNATCCAKRPGTKMLMPPLRAPAHPPRTRTAWVSPWPSVWHLQSSLGDSRHKK